MTYLFRVVELRDRFEVHRLRFAGARAMSRGHDGAAEEIWPA
jgi:hypothetical protein